MVLTTTNAVKMRRAVYLMLWVTVFDAFVTLVTAGTFRNLGKSATDSELSGTRTRILPCLNKLQDIQSEYEALRAVSRHRFDPKEHNVFLRHTATTTSPSELPSISPSLENRFDNDDSSLFTPSSKPSSSPSYIPSSKPSSSPSSIPSGEPSSSLTFAPSSKPSIALTTVTVTGTEQPITNEPTIKNREIDETPSPTDTTSEDDNTDPSEPVGDNTDPSEPEGDNTNPSEPDSDKPGPSEPEGDLTASSIDDFLLQTLSDDGAIFVNGSPQNFAFSALLNTSSELDPNDLNDRVDILQRYALNTLYFSTDGENWATNDLWTSASNPCGVKNENNDVEGAWFGILCDSELKVVEKVSLDSNGLRGRLPSDIRGLSRLNRLQISDNQLSGPLGDDIGKLSDLTVLDIGTNFFTGNIPPSFGDLKSLLLLDISSNFLSGTLAAEITQLTDLLSLSTDSNFLTGTLASELFAIEPLISLDMNNNQFFGPFPSEIGQLSNAISLSFSKNALSGTIPEEIRNLENLESFDASSNFIGGQLPDVFDGLFYLKNFDMALNFLSGTLPQTLLFNATVLNVLNLSGNILGNQLSLPEGLGMMTSLRNLNLSTNQFVGTIPGSIGEMSELVELRLDKNLLTGQLPNNLNLLSDLKILSVSENSLSQFPAGLTGLTKLTELQLSSNNLDEIPIEIFNDDDFQSLEILNVSRNEIDGNVFPNQFQSAVLKTVDFSFNNLNSTFDISSLTGLVNVQNIHMAACAIQSSLPDDINVLQSLVTLNFDNNMFLSGTIPSTLGEIASLENLLLAGNELTGTIPPELAQIENLKILELQSNLLSGTIPNEFDSLSDLTFNFSGNLLSR